MFRFAHPQFLLLLWLVLVLLIFFVFVFRWKKKALSRFGNLDVVKKLIVSVSRGRQIFKISLLLSAVALLAFSVARPQIGTKLEQVKREGIDLIVALDVSLSMKAEDIKPNRLEKAKHEIAGLIDRLEGDRIGLIAFAGVAFVQCPLTLDYNAAKIFLDIMDTDLIPEPGTNITDAILVAMKAFEQMERKYKVLVLITDGENHGDDPLKVAEEAERQGIIIYTVGIGSPKGEPIPLVGETGVRRGFKKDRKGEVVVTKLDEITLEKIALQTNGKYYRATAGEGELDKIYDEVSNMEKKELGSLQYSQFEDRFQYVLIFAIIFLVVEMIVSDRRVIKREWRGRFM